MRKFIRNPKGSRDWLPAEVIKQDYVRKSLVKAFELWGYKPIQTPILINYKTLNLGSNKLSDIAFKLIGEHGEVLALRADLTTPIARVTAERLQEESFPLRFYYVGKVFRYHARKTTNERELYQIGIELIGAKEGLSDLECLKVLKDSLDKLGIKNYLILVNHSYLWIELFRCFGEVGESLYRTLQEKDLILFEVLLAKSNLSKNEKIFWKELIKIKGNKDILRQLKALSKKVKKVKLTKIVSCLSKIFSVFDENVEVDLSLTSDVDYYTGIYFEVVTPYLGRTIGSGGRYDNLIGKFGFDAPAIGFSLCLEDLLLTLERQGKVFPQEKAIKLIRKKRDLRSTFNLINKTQKKGKAVTLKL